MRLLRFLFAGKSNTPITIFVRIQKKFLSKLNEIIYCLLKILYDNLEINIRVFLLSAFFFLKHIKNCVESINDVYYCKYLVFKYRQSNYSN